MRQEILVRIIICARLSLTDNKKYRNWIQYISLNVRFSIYSYLCKRTKVFQVEALEHGSACVTFLVNCNWNTEQAWQCAYNEVILNTYFFLICRRCMSCKLFEFAQDWKKASGLAVAVTLAICVQEMPGSNLGWNTNCLRRDYLCFSSVHPVKCGVVP
jgi:hypothetical protein